MLDFMVLGLPRSGTTWLANWLTTDRSLCLHDPFEKGMPEEWRRDERKFGISCTFSYMLDPWMEQIRCPVALIHRNVLDCQRSAHNMAQELHPELVYAFEKTEGKHFDFAVLSSEEKAAELWSYLLPDLPFDAIRYRELSRMQVQPHMGKFKQEKNVLKELVNRGWLRPQR